MTVFFCSKQARAYTLLFFDSIFHILAWILADAFRHGINLHVGSFTKGEVYITTIILAELFYAMMYISGIDKRQDDMISGVFYSFNNIVKRQFLMLAFLMIYLFTTKQGEDISRIVIVSFAIIDTVFEFIIRIIFKNIFGFFSKRDMGGEKIVVVSLKESASTIAQKLSSDVLKTIVGFIILDEDMTGGFIDDIPVIGNRENILDTHKSYVYDEVFMHLPYDFDISLDSVIFGFEQMGIPVHLNIDVFGLSATAKEIGALGPYHVITFQDRSRKFLPQVLKRMIDIVGAIVGLLFTLIILIIFGPIIKLQSKGPVFFSQIRVGMNGRQFRMYKFRSMVVNAEELKAKLMDQNEMDGLMFKMKDDPRVIPIGRFMRRTSLDEFPQFFNVLKGDMSLVGTRPPTVDEYKNYENYHLRRLSIKPGITGLWQVSGRNNIKDFEDVVRLDLSYIDRWSIMLDIKILVQTVAQIFSGSKNPKDACNILGVNVSPVDMKQTLRLIKANIDNWRGKYICVSNVHTTVMSYEDESYRAIQNNAVLTLPDGKPLSAVAKKRGCETIGRVAGPDLMEEIFEISVKKGYRHFFYGSTQTVIDALSEKLNERYPGINITGMISPPFKELSEEEDLNYVNQINAAKPDFVWIGLGAPKQERYMALHEDKINALMIGVGAGFEFHAGTRKRAPKWMQKCYLEWLYRLMQDPVRLFKRYFTTNGKFLLLVWKENIQRKKKERD